jgi:anthranilate/para-aminobenzoate synthase component I
MKKVILGSLTVAILLAGCGQTVEEKILEKFSAIEDTKNIKKEYLSTDKTLFKMCGKFDCIYSDSKSIISKDDYLQIVFKRDKEYQTKIKEENDKAFLNEINKNEELKKSCNKNSSDILKFDNINETIENKKTFFDKINFYKSYFKKINYKYCGCEQINQDLRHPEFIFQKCENVLIFDIEKNEPINFNRTAEQIEKLDLEELKFIEKIKDNEKRKITMNLKNYKFNGFYFMIERTFNYLNIEQSYNFYSITNIEEAKILITKYIKRAKEQVENQNLNKTEIEKFKNNRNLNDLLFIETVINYLIKGGK